jgi:hypothetical protein
MTTYFCDGLKEVTILNGVARLEFHRLQPTGPAGPNRNVEPVTEMIVALPVQGFLQALTILEQVRDKLTQEGILKPADTAQPVATPPGRSPNFS